MNGISAKRYKELYGAKRKRDPLAPSESKEQQALFRWAKLSECTYPELELLHHIPNGGYRSPKTAAILKAEGVKAGVPDICLPVSRGGYGGLYIEMKIKGNKASTAQIWWMSRLKNQGYCVCVCYGFDEAKDRVIAYLGEQVKAEESAVQPKQQYHKPTEEKMKCKHCQNSDNINAVIYADTENKEYFVYCRSCGIETTETFKSKKAAINAFEGGETTKIKEK